MLTTLFVLVSHALFDWSCRKSPAALAKNFGEIVQESFGVRPDLSTSSPIYKGAKRLYDLTRKKRNSTSSKSAVIKSEVVNLKAFEIDLGSLTVKDDQNQRPVAADKPIQPEVQEPLAIESKSLRKRKNFDELTSRMSKRARVKSVIEILEQDQGLEEKVLDKLETRNAGGKSGDNDFGLYV